MKIRCFPPPSGGVQGREMRMSETMNNSVHDSAAGGQATSIRKGDVLAQLEKDGVWLVRSSDSLPLPADVEAALEEGGVTERDEEAVAKFLQGEERRVRVAAAPPPVDSKVKVAMARDVMSVSLLVSPPSLGGSFPSPDALEEQLRRHGAIYGIDRAALEKLCAERIFDEYVEVARGTPAVHGADAVVEIVVETVGRRGPVEDEEGNVDLKNLGVVNMVHAGDVLATKTPPTKGVDGKNICGGSLGSKDGKDKSFPSGTGTVVSEDGLSLLAAVEGHLTEVNGRLQVLPIFEVNGDVDYSTGNINFSGSVVVKGVVRDGFEVRAGENITVNGTVEGAFLVAGGNITVVGGIRGIGKGNIEAKGNIAADFADQATLIAGGDILIKNALLHSNCRCGGKLIVSGGKKAQLAGGKVQAGSEVVCVTLGSEMGTKTEISVGALPEQIERLEFLRKELPLTTENLEKVEKNILFLKQMETEKGLDDEKRTLLGKLTRTAFSFKASIKELKDETALLEADMERKRERGAVRVKGVCYPGTSVTIRGVTYRVREGFKFGALLYSRGEIKVESFDG